MSSGRRAAAILALGAVLLPTLTAHADDRQACAEAYTHAQTLIRAHRLIEARGQLDLCTRSLCPAFIVRECTSWTGDVERATPSIVFQAKDGSGNDLSAVSVTIDGRPLADRLGGTPLLVDPGEHTFVLETSSAPPVERRLVVAEGVKDRVEQVVLARPPAPAPAAPPPVAAQPSPPPPPPVAESHRPMAGYLLLGAGGVGAVVATVFGIVALGDKSRLDVACGPNTKDCPASSQADIGGLHTSAIASDVGLGVAVVGVGLGGALVLFGRARPSTQASAPGGNADARGTRSRTIRVEPWFGVGGAGLRGSFD